MRPRVGWRASQRKYSSLVWMTACFPERREIGRAYGGMEHLQKPCLMDSGVPSKRSGLDPLQLKRSPGDTARSLRG